MQRPWYVLSFSLVTLACDDTATEPGTAPSDRSPVLAVASNTWRARTNLPSERRFVITATVNIPRTGGSLLYAIGGQSMRSTSNCSGSLSKVQAYDGNSNTWSSKAPLPIPMLKSLAGVINGKIYVAGGCMKENAPLPTLYVYDVAGNRWSEKAVPPISLPSPVGSVVGGKLYVFDQCSWDACEWDFSATGLEAYTFFGFYDPATNRWTRLPLPPLWPIAGAAFNDKLYFLDSSGLVHIYNPGTRAWTTGARRSGSLLGLVTTATVGSQWYLVGETFLSVYNPATNAWVTRAAPPAAYISEHSNAPTAGRVVVGGIGRLELVGGSSPNNWQYTP